MKSILTIIAAGAIVLGIFIDPILSPPSISILHTFKSIINPPPVGPLFIIEYNAKGITPSESLKTTLNFFAAFKNNSHLFSIHDWRNYKDLSDERQPLPLIGSTLPSRAPKQTPLFPELPLTNPYSYTFPSYKYSTPLPRMLSTGILPSREYLKKYKPFFPLIYANEQKRIAFTSPFLATQRLFGNDPRRNKLRSDELHQFSTGADIPLNPKGEFRINYRPGLAKRIKHEDLRSFERFINSNPSPKLIRQKVLDKITLLLPEGEDHEYLLQAFNTLATQEFIYEINWLGWFIFAIPLLLLVLLAVPLKGLLITTVAYLLCSILLYTFGNIITPFLSAGFSSGLIMTVIFIFSGQKRKERGAIPTPDLSTNKKWDRFQMISTIKKSPTAILYRVIDRERRAPALLKVFLEKAGILQQAKRQHLRRAYARIKSPFLANIYETSRIEDYVYQLTEDRGEIPLSAILTEGPLGVERTVNTAEQILRAMESCHKNRLIHGNLTPSNILIDRTGAIKLTDFGWTLLQHDTTSPNTLKYKAPELIDEKRRPDPKADLYSLGVIMFEMLTGENPFKAGSVEELKREKENTPQIHIREKVFEVPQWLDDFVLRLMSRKHADRPLSASQALELLHIGYGK